jgi:hypothetical protein
MAFGGGLSAQVAEEICLTSPMPLASVEPPFLYHRKPGAELPQGFLEFDPLRSVGRAGTRWQEN